MKLNNAEKLILLMLSEIYEKLGLTDVDTKLLSAAIHSDNTWALDWEMPGVVGENPEETPSIVREVLEYLDMWSALEEAYASLDEEEKRQIEKEAEPFGRHVRFPGFDGNNESKLLSIARLLVEDMGRFSRFQGRDLNSHVSLRQNYARMLRVFEPLRVTSSGARRLNENQIASVLKAMRHPEK